MKCRKPSDPFSAKLPRARRIVTEWRNSREGLQLQYATTDKETDWQVFASSLLTVENYLLCDLANSS